MNTYKKLSEKTRQFVDAYVEEVVGIVKMEQKNVELGLIDLVIRNDKSEGEEKLQNTNTEKVGNIGKLIDKKKYGNQVVNEEGKDVYFEGYNPEFLSFLFPEFEATMHDPYLMKDMQRAVERVVKAVLAEETICIYGDYDCDGVPGTALVKDFFEAIGYEKVVYYIPDRHKEGYGLNEGAIKYLANYPTQPPLTKGRSTSLLITIDLGTTNVKEVDLANELGMDVIITDHHLPIQSEDGEVLPKAFAIINNKQASDNYPDKNLSGSGTIWKLISALIIYNEEHKIWQIGKGLHKWMLDLVGIATIADMVHLKGENRTLAIYGLHVIKNTRREGLQTLLRNAKVEVGKLSEDDVAFSIAPRVNAASRMDHPVHALNMFSQNVKLGLDSAHHLELLNQTRKENVASIMRKVHQLLDERILSGELPQVVVVGDSDWAPGVLGLISSAVTEKYGRTSFVWGKGEDENIFKGSCRSSGDLHLVKLMTEHQDLFTHFGGHEEAGGFAIHFDKVHTLEKKLNEKNKLEKSLTVRDPSLREGAEGGRDFFEIDLEDVTSEFITGLGLLGPFGVGNPKPIFRIRNIDRFELARFGKKGEHLKIVLQSRTTKREAIKFFVDAQKEKELAQSVRELRFVLEPGFRNGPARLRVK